eukprot:CAMPEP_0174837514 /NCGR_PEP_ID=MMETSP1114-20130205/6794_1 /TAXON_ID=312471 /ORGANISM="Neobodo designis, Strain CCAP 1951/1" /LENGTH=207 /DNA_ID=CAMNT_0016071581 /DNA_START=87 /DNA_END=707 /DNA_ORIENTATION=+
MADDEAAQLRERVATLEAELKEQQELAAAFEEELKATIADRDEERKTAALCMQDHAATAKKAKLEANDALADMNEACEARRVAEAALHDAKQKQRAAEREAERLEALERQHAFDLKKATAEADKAVEEALMMQTTVEELRGRLRAVEGELMHAIEERDEARKLAAAAPQPAAEAEAAASSRSASASAGPISQDMQHVLGRLRHLALE